jgi:hypothetical protein
MAVELLHGFHTSQECLDGRAECFQSFGNLGLMDFYRSNSWRNT